MASKRRLRRKECEGKGRHETREAALIQIKKMKNSESAGAYKCRHCPHWHVGHVRGSRYLITSHLAAAVLYHD
ncbi:MAG TPA: hypothetical protein VK961_06985 [Chthoniobacter sp.]|nr:hypothetical protein [Chthoniobacter sp.]